ncbi:unnamed protein product [Ciceribacter sp. T2.26MG-112.2]|nr:unnamed protein product [Ciceribacter naphthalenivorans]
MADRLKVSEATVRHWIKEGALRAIDIGKGWRVSDIDFDDFLHRHETRPRQSGATLLPTVSDANATHHPDRLEH